MASGENISTSDDDEEYDVSDVQEQMPDAHSVSVENAQENQPDGEEEFEEIEFLEIQLDDSVNAESFGAAPNGNDEQCDVGNDQNSLAAGSSVQVDNTQTTQSGGEIDHDVTIVSVKEESLVTDPLRTSLVANESIESNDCEITSAYFIQEVKIDDETEN